MSTKSKPTNKRLFFPMGGKGGVGKTLLLLTLADYFGKSGKSYIALDADAENAGKAAAFSSFVKAGRPNLRDIGDCDKLLMSSAEAESGITLCDLPANASGDFLEWFDAVASKETLDELNLELVAIGAITPEPATFASVAEWAERLQDRAKYVVVLNRRIHGRVTKSAEDTFPEFYGSRTGSNFREAFSPPVIEIPGLYEGTAAAWIKSGLLPSDAADEGSPLTVLDRSRLRTWISAIHTQWQAAGF